MDVAPDSAPYDPTGQAEHTPVPTASLYKPWSQIEQTSQAANGQSSPSPHTAQCCVATVVLEIRIPVGQLFRMYTSSSTTHREPSATTLTVLLPKQRKPEGHRWQL
eukprot:166669-Rhodomonas_salina.1